MNNSIILKKPFLAVAAIGVLSVLTAIGPFTHDALAESTNVPTNHLDQRDSGTQAYSAYRHKDASPDQPTGSRYQTPGQVENGKRGTWSGNTNGDTVSGPVVEMVEVTNVTDSTAEISVTVANPDSETLTVNLRYRTPRGSGTWLTVNSQATSSTSTDFTLGSLATNSNYEVQASLDNTFDTRARSAAFTTDGPPTNLSVSVAPADGQLKLTWSVSLNGGEVTSQLVQWKLASASSFTGTANPAIDARHWDIVNLTNETAYTVNVTVRTNYGSITSADITQNPVSVPSISDITFPTIGRTSANAIVSVINSELATGTLTVKLRYRVKGAQEWSDTVTRAVSGGTASFQLSGLTGNTEYEVAASLEDDFETSVVRDLLTAKTTPGPPEGVAITKGDSVLNLSWSAPINDGGEPIDEYIIQWRTGDQGFSTSRQLRIESDINSAQITSLVNGTEYTVSIFATNALGNGTPVEVKGTPSTVPGTPPTSVTASACDPDLRLSWRPPTDDGGSPITSYIIQWKSGSQDYDPSTRQEISETADAFFAFEGLQSNTEYTVRIAAVNANVDTTNIAASVLWSSELSVMPRSGVCLTGLRFDNPLATSVIAYVSVEDALPQTVVYLRYRPDNTSSWVSTLTQTTGSGTSTVTFDITGLTPSTKYEVEASLDAEFSLNGSTIRGFFTTGVGSGPERPGDGSSAKILRIEPGVTPVTLELGDEAVLWVDVYGRQNILDNTLADREPSANRPSFVWSTSGQGSFEEADINPEWRNSRPDDRQVVLIAPTVTGTFRIEANLPSASDCLPQQSDETAEEAAARCMAVFMVRVKRESGSNVEPEPPVNPEGTIPDVITTDSSDTFDVVTPEGGGTTSTNGASVDVDQGAVPNGEYIGIRITPIGPVSNDGKTGQPYTLVGTEYKVSVVDADGELIPSYTFKRPVTICVPLPDELRSDLSDIALVSIDDEGELAPMATDVRIGQDGIRVCGRKSEFPANVAVSDEGSPPLEPQIEEDHPETGGIAPSPMIVIVSTMLGITTTITGLTLWRRLRGRTATDRSV